MRLLLAGFLYLVSHVVDGLYTLTHLKGLASEGNLPAREYMFHFGTLQGLVIYKALLIVIVVAALMYVRLKSGKWSEGILLGGAIATTVGGCLWLLV